MRGPCPDCDRFTASGGLGGDRGRSIREPDTRHDFDGLPELRLRGLAEEDARTLLMSAVPGRIDDRVRDRIVAETRGNPLALLDLPRSMSAAELAGGFELLPALSHTPQAPPTASYGSSYVEPLTSGETRTTTLRLEPRAAEGSA